MAKVKRLGNRMWYGLAMMIVGLWSFVGRTPPAWATEAKAGSGPSLQERLYAQGATVQGERTRPTGALYAQAPRWTQPKGWGKQPGSDTGQPKGYILSPGQGQEQPKGWKVSPAEQGQPKGLVEQPGQVQPKGVVSAQPQGTVYVPPPQPKAWDMAPRPEQGVEDQMTAKVADLQQRVKAGTQLDAGELALIRSYYDAAQLEVLGTQLNLLMEQLKTIEEKLGRDR